MRKFSSIDTICLKNIGIVEVVELPEGMQRSELLGWLGEEVEIDGKTLRVYGAESPCIMSLGKGERIGILVQSWREKR